jgi:hypothetical protein
VGVMGNSGTVLNQQGNRNASYVFAPRFDF